MAVSTKIIRRRIRSIGNTKKITKAMELVSAAKMRKAVQQTLASRMYAGDAWALLANLAKRTDARYHPLLHRRDPAERIGVILVSSNRGLCGAFNANIAAQALQFREKNIEHIEWLTIGKKARDIIRRNGAVIVADFEKPDVTTSVAEVSALAHSVIDGFIEKKYDRVYLAYTDFVSSLKQVPRLKLLLPLESTGADEYLGAVGEAKGNEEEKKDYEYIFEPDPAALFQYLLPRLIELQVYQAVLESDASEHSARMFAMRNATDAAGEMIDELTLAFNRARQAGITQEIAEIAGGKAAIES